MSFSSFCSLIFISQAVADSMISKEFGEIQITPFSEFNFVVSIALDENACLLKDRFSLLSVFEITLVINPAINFEETLGAILLALKVFEKTIRLESSASSAIILAVDPASSLEIFGKESIDEVP